MAPISIQDELGSFSVLYENKKKFFKAWPLPQSREKNSRQIVNLQSGEYPSGNTSF